MTTASELNQGKELKPCPFCGGEPHIERRGNARFSTIVSCLDCGVTHECGDTGSDVGDGWNRRSSEAPSRRGEGDKPPPFKLPVRVMRFRNRCDETNISHIGDSSGSWVASVSADCADAIVEALNKNTGAS